MGLSINSLTVRVMLWLEGKKEQKKERKKERQKDRKGERKREEGGSNIRYLIYFTFSPPPVILSANQSFGNIKRFII